jgi:hypothetical protein
MTHGMQLFRETLAVETEESVTLGRVRKRNRWDSRRASHPAASLCTQYLCESSNIMQTGGVMILSKPALLAGFDHQSGNHNVGVHEFAHLVEKGASEYGLPPEVP